LLHLAINLMRRLTRYRPAASSSSTFEGCLGQNENGKSAVELNF
jgi:hypothetical protein